MSGSGETPAGKSAAQAERDRRLAEALRRNLRLRKEAASPAAHAQSEGLTAVGGEHAAPAVLAEALADLLRATQAAHHAADPGDHSEWVLWYARYMQPLLEELLYRPYSVSEVVELLVRAERERLAEPLVADWPSLYARVILRQCGFA